MKAIVLCFDRLHLGFLGCYGNPWIQTPHFNRLASDSIVFDQFFAGESGCETFEGFFSDAGIGVRVVVDAASDQAEQAFEGVSQTAITQSEALWEDATRYLEELTDSSLLWIQAPGPNLESSHETAETVEPDYEAITSFLLSFVPQGDVDDARMTNWAEYARQVTQLDSQLGKFLTAVDRETDDDPPLLIVTANAGERVLDPGRDSTEEMGPHEEVAHSPLLIRVPGSPQVGSRRLGLTQAADIPATLARWFGIPQPTEFREGRDLQPFWCDGDEGRLEKVREFIFFEGEEGAWAVRSEDFLLKSSRSASPQLYIKPDDRFDQADVAAQYPDVVDELEEAWTRFKTSSPDE